MAPPCNQNEVVETACECESGNGTADCDPKKACVYINGGYLECLPVITDGYTIIYDDKGQPESRSACATSTKAGTPAFYSINKVCTKGGITELPDCNGSPDATVVTDIGVADSSISSPKTDKIC